MDAERVTEYLSIMHGAFMNPLVSEHFGAEYAPDKEEHRLGAIRAFSMG